MNREILKKRLKELFKTKLGYAVTDWNKSFHDAGAYGLDAYVFFDDLSEEFNVDFSNLDYKRYGINDFYFVNPIKDLFKYWGKKRDFTLNHLLDVIEKKKWFDPD